MTTAIVPRVSGGEAERGHLEEFRTDPIGLMQRVREECGDVGMFRDRCVGAAFATMQIKAIFSVLLREYDFEMAQPPDSYHDDHSKMVVQLAQPARVRYRRRRQECPEAERA